MFRKSHDGSVTPLYIGKTETAGKQNGNLSANIKGLQRDKSKFARWGDGHQYHIGDLSAATLTGYPVEKIQPKYRNWSQSLFRLTPSDRPVLKAPVYCWATRPLSKSKEGDGHQGLQQSQSHSPGEI